MKQGKSFFTTGRILAFVAILGYAWAVQAKTYSHSQCDGSLRPYPTEVTIVAYPDSLTPMSINHVGRHGSRYPAGPYSARTMHRVLTKADSLGTITPLGGQFLGLINRIIAESEGRWGALDSIGMAEHRAIARRMKNAYPMLFDGKRVEAQSSHSPRAIMSMYSFTHQLAECSKQIEIETRSGKALDEVLRPFDVNKKYKQYMTDKTYMADYNRYLDSIAPMTITRLIGEKYPATTRELKELSVVEYYNFANLEAMGMTNEWQRYMSIEEYNALWSCFNLRQYFMHCRQPDNSVPADIADVLLLDIIGRTNDIANGAKNPTAFLRFTHQETVLPLISKLKVEGSYVDTPDWANLKDRFHDFDLCPMAANVQFILFKAPSGTFYCRVDVNEKPIEIMPGKGFYAPWDDFMKYIMENLLN